MAKSTKAQEVTTGTPDSYNEHELSDPTPPVVVTRAMLGEVPCQTTTDGGDSSTSSEQTTPSDGQKQPQGPAPAQNVENLSSPPEESSIAPLTGGSGAAPSPDEEEPYSDYSYAELQHECKERGLSASGKTEDLIARLVEDDEKADSEELE